MVLVSRPWHAARSGPRILPVSGRPSRSRPSARCHALLTGIAGAGISRCFGHRILRLALLAPDIVEAILGGWADQRVMLERLERPLPAGWMQQRPRIARSGWPWRTVRAALLAAPADKRGETPLTRGAWPASPLLVCLARLRPTALPGEMVDAVKGVGVVGDRAALGKRLHAGLERRQAWIVLEPLGAERG